nr:DNA internalization-related competence protein ComEC/Rec2 [Amphibacillus cookii]
MIISGVWLILLTYWTQTKRLPILGCISLIGVTLFFFQYYRYPMDDLELTDGDQLTITGKIINIESESAQYRSFWLRTHSDKVKVVDFSNHPPDTFNVGATCQIVGTVERFEEATNPGQFNYSHYLENQGISYQLYADSHQPIQCEGNDAIGSITMLRKRILEKIDLSLKNDTMAIWMKSLVLGERSAIEDTYLQLFQRWHLTHLLSISGLHVCLLIGLLYGLCNRLIGITKETTYFILLVLLSFYPLLAGGSPSVWRACIVGILNLLSWLFHRRIQPIDFLSISFILLLLLQPAWMYHIGFQFSFIITFSLLLSAKILSMIKGKIVKAIFITILSMVVILPLQIHYFYVFNPMSLLINTIVSWYFAVFFIPSMFITFISIFVFPFLLPLFTFFITIVHDLFLNILLFADQYLYKPLIIGEFPSIYMVAFYVSFYYFLNQFEKQNFKKVLSSLLSIILIIASLLVRPYLNPYGKVTMLDIGQADALVIQLPHKKGVILYDVGGSFTSDFSSSSDRLYQQVIKPYLFYEGISKIDAIIISHEDHDHLGSLAYLIEDFTVGHLITSQYLQFPKELKDKLDRDQIEHQIIRPRQAFDIAGQAFVSLGPTRDWLDRNDNSLVLYTKFADTDWLLTGDISEKVEIDLIHQYPSLEIDILSVAHHGSATSSGLLFLEGLNVKTALISAGRNNRFQHPHDDVIERLFDLGVKIYRTDHHGAVQFIYHEKQSSGTFLPFLP